MKQTLKLALLCTVTVFAMHAKKDKDSVLDAINQKVSRIRQIVTEINDKEKCTYEIHASDIGTTGYTITKPGTYCLVDDVVFNPPTPAAGTVVAAITINSSNVTLILGDHYLGQAGAVDPSAIPTYPATTPSSQSPFVIGILVPDVIPTNTNVNAVGLESIYISGDQAIIDGFSMYGIRVFGHTNDIRLNNITVKNCGVLASHALRPNVSYSPHSGGVAPFGVAGIAIGEENSLGMGPVFFTQFTGAQNRVAQVVLDTISCLDCFENGIFIANATNVAISNCHFDGTFSDDPTISTVGAVFGAAALHTEDPNVVDLTVENSTFNSTALKGDLTTLTPGLFNFICVGMRSIHSQNVVFSNCNFDNTNNTFPSNGNNVTVGVLLGGVEDMTFINCSTNFVTSISDNTQGFHASGIEPTDTPPATKSSRNLRLINHICYNIQQLGNLQLPAPFAVTGNSVLGNVFGPAMGYDIVFAKNVYLENCLAQDIICNGPATTTARCYGFNVGSVVSVGNTIIIPENWTAVGCIASRVLTLNGGQAIGFATNGTSGNEVVLSTVLKGCIAEDCQSLIPTLTVNLPALSQNIGCGFLHFPETSDNSSFPTLHTECQALNNQGVPSITVGANTLYSAGFACIGTGTALTARATKQEYDNCIALSNVYGFLFSRCDSNIVRNCRSDVNITNATIVPGPATGEGFTDVGPGGTPAAPGISTSLFENNRAYNNGGNDTTYFGVNSNYNVFVAPGITPPLLEVQVSNPAGSYTPINPATYFAGVDNVSTIQ